LAVSSVKINQVDDEFLGRPDIKDDWKERVQLAVAALFATEDAKQLEVLSI
jgi:hypothetical protein